MEILETISYVFSGIIFYVLLVISKEEILRVLHYNFQEVPILDKRGKGQ